MKMKSNSVEYLTLIMYIALFAFCFWLAVHIPSRVVGKQHEEPKTECLEYNNLRQIYYSRLDQLRVGEINHRQYRDSVYVDFENYMIGNK